MIIPRTIKMIRSQSNGVKNVNRTKSIKSKATANKSKKSDNNNNVKNKSQIASDKKSIKSTSVDTSEKNETQNATFPPFSERKLERANSFFLTRQLTKIYNSLTASKESLHKIPENHKDDKKPPYKFGRSVSLATITLRKEYRNSIRKPKLEQLSEEDHNGGIQTFSKSYSSNKKMSTASMDSLDSRSSDKSFSLMSSLKRTFSLTPAKRKQMTNSKWNASLLSLQQIDVMISYEDLSFINYDKLNTYEENLKKNLCQSDLKTRRQSMSNISMQKINAFQRKRATSEMDEQTLLRYPNVRRDSRANPLFAKRRHSAYPQSALNHSEIDIDSMIYDDESKRWSNLCVNFSSKSNIDNGLNPLHASILKMDQHIGSDVVDCANYNRSVTNDIEVAVQQLRKAQSTDNIYFKDAEKSFTWHTVSVFFCCIFLSIHVLCSFICHSVRFPKSL